MSVFGEKIIDRGFTVKGIDLSSLNKLEEFLPKNGVIDLNIAEQGLVVTLEAQNFCQEIIIKLDQWISYKEADKSQAWAAAALTRAPASGVKTAKEKEWFANADDEYVEACNQLQLAKAAKKWFESKASYFSGWHYAFKTFLRRDYSLESIANVQKNSYNIEYPESSRPRSASRQTPDAEVKWTK